MALHPSEVYQALVPTLELYRNELDNYSDEDFFRKDSEERWSVGQVYEHLTATALYFFLKRATYAHEQRNGQWGGEKNEYGEKQFKYNSFPPIKIKIPEVLKGPEPVAKSREAYRELLLKIQEDSLQISEQIANDLGEYKVLQPAFGWLTAWEWFQLMEQHFRHHLRQKQELDTWLGLINS
ncbi:MAG: DinB family protein [Spirosomataceae bacterium]